jgi:hypothetical protein
MDAPQSPPDLKSAEFSRHHQPNNSYDDAFFRKDHGSEEDSSFNGDLWKPISSSAPCQQAAIPEQHPEAQPEAIQELSADLDMKHTELLVHLALDKDIICVSLGDDAFSNPASFSLALKTGLQSPYLMHELLAISALHLASLNPTRSEIYLHQAIILQSRALSLFNSECNNINNSNCVAVLLFSSILGHHLLADTLAKRDPGGLDAFMENYVHCIKIHRGIHTIAMTAWPQLMESDLEPILSSSSRFTSRFPKGGDCRHIIELVDTSRALDEEEKEACRLLIRHLQVGFDAAAGEQQQGYRHYMIYTWLMLAPPKFIDLLLKKTPEALILLAYYSILLHHGRGLWQVGDAGVHVFQVIRDYLHPQWHIWLQHPQKLILPE